MKRTSANELGRQLLFIYDAMDRHFGDLNWWPGEDPFEVVIGAILTQNTNWGNVEKAVTRLKATGQLSPRALHQIPIEQLAELIRPAGYYNIKAERVKAFLHFLYDEYNGNLQQMFAEETWPLRDKLLGVKGIGEETADSILLYAGYKPVFVVDLYTRRLLSRHGIAGENARYDEVQKLFMDHLPSDVRFYNQYHALLVYTGKHFCRKKAFCKGCPLEAKLPANGETVMAELVCSPIRTREVPKSFT
jgi:endonuclease III related protein